jgi:hypothetical protein
MKDYSPGSFAPWSIARTFNVLLAASKDAKPDDPVVASIEPLRANVGGDLDAVAIRILALQLHAAVGSRE